METSLRLIRCHHVTVQAYYGIYAQNPLWQRLHPHFFLRFLLNAQPSAIYCSFNVIHLPHHILSYHLRNFHCHSQSLYTHHLSTLRTPVGYPRVLTTSAIKTTIAILTLSSAKFVLCP